MATVVIDPNTAKEDRRRARMGALAVTLTKTDRILTGRDDVTCALYIGDSPAVDAPAWNDGKRITIHADKLPSIESASGLVTTLGLNHHEVSHILFSLGNQTPFIGTIVARGHFDAYNLLEDMRIERLFSDLYISAKKYLTAPVLHFIVENEDLWPTAHLLTYGRRYLPLEIRKEFRKRFTGSASMRRDAEKLIDEFRAIDMSDVTTHTRAAEIVKLFHELLEQLKPKLSSDQQEALNGHKGCKGVKEFTNDRAKVAKAEKDASRRLGDDDDDEDEDEEPGEYDEDGNYMGDDSEDDGESDETESGSGRGKGSSDEDEDSSASGSGDPDEDEEDDPNTPGDSGRGSGPSGDGQDGEDDGDGLGIDGDEGGSLGAPGGMSAAEIANAIKDAMDALEEDAEVKDEITRLQDSMNDVNNMDAVIPDDRYRDRAPSAAAGSASQAVIREFQVLNTPFEAGWEYGTDHGRVNMQRAMTAEFGDMDFYDLWDEGREADAAMEAVVLVDKSGSMDGEMASASEAAWVVKRGMDEVDAKSVMITFGESTYRLYGRNEKADPSKVRHTTKLEMATYPDNGMKEARMILNESDRPNRLFVVITDGGFSSTRNEYDPVTGRYTYPSIDYKGLLESINATRVYIGIRTESDRNLRGCYDVHAKISKPEEIPAIIKQAVASMLSEAWKRR